MKGVIVLNKKIISLLVVLLPILEYYKSPIPRVDLGTFCFLLCLPLIFNHIKKNRYILNNKKKFFWLIFFCVYILLTGVIINLFIANLNISLMLLRIFKFILLISEIVVLIYSGLFDFKISINYLKRVTVISCLFIILQSIAYYFFDMTIPGVIYPLILQGNYFDMSYEYASQLYLYRPTSFFLEPSMFAEYIILYFTYLLFQLKEFNYKIIVTLLIIGVGMICSTSGSGYLYIFIATILYLFFNIKKHKKIISFLIVTLFFVIAVFYFNPSLIPDFVLKALNRGIDGTSSGGSAFIGRIESFSYFNNLDSFNKIFGIGFGNPVPNVFMNSISYLLYCCGIVVIIIFSFFIIKLLFLSKRNSFNMSFIIVWIISMFFTTSFTAVKICFYLPFLSDNNDSELEVEH